MRKLTITAKQLRKELKALWPQIIFPWLVDVVYEMAPTSEIVAVLFESKIADIPRKPPKWECDKTALAFDCRIKEWCRDNEDMQHQAAFGECFATRIHGREVEHTLNINRDESGWWLINNDAKTHWKTDNAKDYINLIRM